MIDLLTEVEFSEKVGSRSPKLGERRGVLTSDALTPPLDAFHTTVIGSIEDLRRRAKKSGHYNTSNVKISRIPVSARKESIIYLQGFARTH